MNLETKRFIGRPRNTWQDKVRGVGGDECQEKVYNKRNGRSS
jgi:hypothetical protein